MTSFDAFGLRPEIVQAVTELGYATPTPVQTAAVPLLLAGNDVIAQAHTGTGKTAAFALPMLHALDATRSGVQGLVLAPTRELATQVARAITRYGRHLGAHAAAVYGGQSYSYQRKRLESGAQVVVGTPGRTLDLIKRGNLDLSTVRFAVLDEADEMLRMGFIEDVEAILAATPAERQTALFSATIPDPIRRLAERYMRTPRAVGESDSAKTVAGVTQRYHVVEEKSKLAALARLLEAEEIRAALVFARTRVGCAELAEALVARGFAAEALHGDMSQDAREAVLRRFRGGQCTLLVATDVAARGLDVPTVSHVLNFDFPDGPQEYVHRIGRTARAGESGIAISLVAPRETGRVAEVAFYTKSPLKRMVLPTIAEVHARRDYRFAQRLDQVSGADAARHWVEERIAAGADPVTLAAAAVHLLRANEAARPDEEVREVFAKSARRAEPAAKPAIRRARAHGEHEAGMVRLALEVGRAQGIRAGDIVATIARETGIPGTSIGAIRIGRARTTVDVLESCATQVLRKLRKGLRLRGQNVRVEKEG